MFSPCEDDDVLSCEDEDVLSPFQLKENSSRGSLALLFL